MSVFLEFWIYCAQFAVSMVPALILAGLVYAVAAVGCRCVK